MKRAVVTFAEGSWYQRGQRRLVESLQGVRFSGTVHAFKGHAHLGCPPHSSVMYGFKVYALRYAQRLGYDTVLWLDSSVYAVGDVDPVFSAVEESGVLVYAGGWKIGQWTSDRMLEHFGVSREDALGVPMVEAMFQGYDLRSSVARDVLDRYEAALPFFSGKHNNSDRTESQDSRCLGHRHDQSALSLALHSAGVPLQTCGGPGCFLDILGPSGPAVPGAVLHARGM